MSPKVTRVYIDGFNLYYGALNYRKRGFKWLNISELLVKIFKPSQYDIAEIKFFTAKVSATRKDPHKNSRQAIYLRALKTLPNITIIFGNFIKKKQMVRVSDDVSILSRVYEEKGTDVNIATHLVNDAHLRRFTTAIVVSNDSDLADALRIVTIELGLEVVVLNPSGGNPSAVLNKYTSFIRPLRQNVVTASQFSDNLVDGVGQFSKPKDW